MSRLQQEAIDAIRRQAAWALAHGRADTAQQRAVRLMQQGQQQQSPKGNSHH